MKRAATLPAYVSAGKRFAWKPRPRRKGVVAGVVDDHVIVRVDGRDAEQQWWVKDVARWIRDGLLVFGTRERS